MIEPVKRLLLRLLPTRHSRLEEARDESRVERLLWASEQARRRAITEQRRLETVARRR